MIGRSINNCWLVHSKQLSNPFSTGGGGGHFEIHVQASFVVLMLTGGYAPCLPCWPISKLKLQARVDGYNTDDLIVFSENPKTNEISKMLCQVKHSMTFTKGNSVLSEVIRAAWLDFNNTKIFTKNLDIIAFIIGHLNTTDTINIRWLLGQARHTANATEFFSRIEETNFCSTEKRNKLKVLSHHLRIANDDKEVSKEEQFEFFRHFHLLGYDLGDEVGVVLSLLHSHISQLNAQAPNSFWCEVLETVQNWNQDAGTITKENLPKSLKEYFKPKDVARIPINLLVPGHSEWKQHEYATDLALANLVGAWNEKNEADKTVLNQITKQSYSILVEKVRAALHLAETKLTHYNGLWEFTERTIIWDDLGTRIFDEHLDIFKTIAISVLTEKDPAFELEPSERYLANIQEKVLTHSTALRKGLAETLALLGNRANSLINCTNNKASTTVVKVINEILVNADWVLWGSLNSLLPTLAEAAPGLFLEIVEETLKSSNCPFNRLFSQETNGVFGVNYLTGLLWALECIAWDEKYLTSVCITLAKLAKHDSGGASSNRPMNSLITILLPWLPQTCAPIEKQQLTVRSLKKELPDITWRLTLSLLPNTHQYSTGSYKPSWREILPGFNTAIKPEDYNKQLLFYSELAVEMAGNDLSRLCELIEYLTRMPKVPRDKLLQTLTDKTITTQDETKRLPLWNKLNEFVLSQRRFYGDDELTCAIESIAVNLAPSEPSVLYRPLFLADDFLYQDQNIAWDEQQKNREKRQQEAIGELLQSGGLDSVLNLAELVESPGHVGSALAYLASYETDFYLLPKFLEADAGNLAKLVYAYVITRFEQGGWVWVDSLEKSTWATKYIVRFLSYLPFTSETWKRAAILLKRSENRYWKNAHVLPSDECNDFAIKKLMNNGRVYAAIDCLYWLHSKKRLINFNLVLEVLKSAVTSSEPSNSSAHFSIAKLIKALQNESKISFDSLCEIEWIFLNLDDVRPKCLEISLASNPGFFCDVIKMIYRSENGGSRDIKHSGIEKVKALNAYELITRWRTPPGKNAEGEFIEEDFQNWLWQVKKLCAISGHMKVALRHVGSVLVYSPPDINGLWINSVIAKALDEEDADDMRKGFILEIYNSRGVYTIDPQRTEERSLAEKYRKMGQDLENALFRRFSEALYSIADYYDEEANKFKFNIFNQDFL